MNIWELILLLLVWFRWRLNLLGLDRKSLRVEYAIPLFGFELLLSHSLALFLAHLRNLVIAVLDLPLLLLDQPDHLVHTD